MPVSRPLYFLVVGIFFGITLLKSGAASWFRIYEMFHFASFHMFGIIGSSLTFGLLFNQLIKRFKVKDLDGNPITQKDKNPGITRYLVGGTVFGIGWAIAGACPGPMFTLIGAGYWPVILVFASTMLGTYVYGVVRDRLPH